jgi:hypothetical protein
MVTGAGWPVSALIVIVGTLYTFYDDAILASGYVLLLIAAFQSEPDADVPEQQGARAGNRARQDEPHAREPGEPRGA